MNDDQLRTALLDATEVPAGLRLDLDAVEAGGRRARRARSRRTAAVAGVTVAVVAAAGVAVAVRPGTGAAVRPVAPVVDPASPLPGFVGLPSVHLPAHFQLGADGPGADVSVGGGQVWVPGAFAERTAQGGTRPVRFAVLHGPIGGDLTELPGSIQASSVVVHGDRAYLVVYSVPAAEPPTGAYQEGVSLQTRDARTGALLHSVDLVAALAPSALTALVAEVVPTDAGAGPPVVVLTALPQTPPGFRGPGNGALRVSAIAADGSLDGLTPAVTEPNVGITRALPSVADIVTVEGGSPRYLFRTDGTRVDLRSGALRALRTLPAFTPSRPLVVGEVGGRIAAADTAGSTVSLVDPDTATVTATVGVASTALFTAGGHLFNGLPANAGGTRELDAATLAPIGAHGPSVALPVVGDGDTFATLAGTAPGLEDYAGDDGSTLTAYVPAPVS